MLVLNCLFQTLNCFLYIRIIEDLIKIIEKEICRYEQETIIRKEAERHQIRIVATLTIKFIIRNFLDRQILHLVERIDRRKREYLNLRTKDRGK